MGCVSSTEDKYKEEEDKPLAPTQENLQANMKGLEATLQELEEPMHSAESEERLMARLEAGKQGKVADSREKAKKPVTASAAPKHELSKDGMGQKDKAEAQADDDPPTVNVEKPCFAATLNTTLEGAANPTCLAFVDGSTILSGSADFALRLWNIAEGTCTATLRGHIKAVTRVAVFGNTAASSSEENNMVKLWDLNAPTCAKTIQDHIKGHTGEIKSVAFSPDGATLASGGNRTDKSIRLWDAETGAHKATIEGARGPVDGIAFSPDNKLIAAAGCPDVWLWDASSGKNVAKLKSSKRSAQNAVVFSSDGNHVLACSNDGGVRVWEVATGDCKLLEGHSDWVTCLALTPGHVVSGGKDGCIKIWDWAKSGECVATLEAAHGGETITCLAVQGKTLVSGSYSSIKVWTLTE